MKLPTLVALVVVTAIAAGFRFTAPAHGLPCDPEPDIYTVRHVETLRRDGLFDRYLAGWKYPILFGTVAAALPWEASDPPLEAPLEEHLAAASAAHRWTRLVSAVVAVLSVPLTLLFALRFVGLGAATLAALFVATSGLHTWMSVQARPHAPTAAMVLLALIASAKWIERRRGRDAVLAGVAAGLSAAALHSGAISGVVLAVAGVVVLARGGLRALPWVLAGGAIALAFVVWGYGLEPHEPRDWYVREATYLEKTGADENHVAFGGHLLRSDVFNGKGFVVLARALRELDPVLGLTALLGVAVAFAGFAVPRVRRSLDRAGTTVALAAFVPFMLVFGLYEFSYDRFFLPIYPLFAIAAALGLGAIAGRLGLGTTARVFGAAAILALPTLTSLKLAWLVTQPTAHDQVSAAVREELEGTGRSAVLVEVEPVCAWSPPRLAAVVPPTHPNRWLTYQSRRLAEWGALPPGLDAVPAALDVGPAIAGARDRRAALARYLGGTEHDLVVLATSWHNEPASVHREPLLADWRAALEESGWTLARTIAPVERHRVEGLVPFVDLPSLFRRTALGDRHELYRRGRER